ncbi:MAG: hypothetical protein ACMUHB_02320 [Thermoplasmatota archaeon]
MERYIVGALILLMGFALIAGCTYNRDVDETDDWSMTINGIDYKFEDILDDFEKTSVRGSNDVEYEGVSLKALLEDAGVSDLSVHTYTIAASDGYTKEVTYLDIEAGIIVQDDHMTVFPDLPGKYRVKDVVSIEPVDGDTITINGKLFTWMQPFDIFTSDIQMKDDENNTYEGILLSDLMNGTAVDDPQDFNYTITAVGDGYSVEVTWDDMMRGLLVNDDDHMAFFPHLARSYRVKDVNQIEVVSK